MEDRKFLSSYANELRKSTLKERFLFKNTTVPPTRACTITTRSSIQHANYLPAYIASHRLKKAYEMFARRGTRRHRDFQGKCSRRSGLKLSPAACLTCKTRTLVQCIFPALQSKESRNEKTRSDKSLVEPGELTRIHCT